MLCHSRPILHIRRRGIQLTRPPPRPNVRTFVHPSQFNAVRGNFMQVVAVCRSFMQFGAVRRTLGQRAVCSNASLLAFRCNHIAQVLFSQTHFGTIIECFVYTFLLFDEWHVLNFTFIFRDKCARLSILPIVFGNCGPQTQKLIKL